MFELRRVSGRGWEMTVKELIEALGNADPEAVVMVGTGGERVSRAHFVSEDVLDRDDTLGDLSGVNVVIIGNRAAKEAREKWGHD